MSIPDIDYELGAALGQFEYSVPMASARPEDISSVALAFRAGETKVLDLLKSIATKDGIVCTSILQVEEMLNRKSE